MKTIVIIEEQDIIDATKRHYNGQAFKLVSNPEYSDLFIGYGNYLMPHLLQGFELHLYELIEKRNGEPINLSSLLEITPEFRLKLAELTIVEGEINGR